MVNNTNNGFLLYRGAPLFVYAASIASTWIWAPALFVSSGQAYRYGLWGFLMFWIPNVLTLLLFGCVAERVRKSVCGVTVADAVGRASGRQKNLHRFVSCVILVCSTAVQLLGFCVLLSAYTSWSREAIVCAVSLLAFVTVAFGGIRHSILTDAGKWIIMAAGGAVLLAFTGTAIDAASFDLTAALYGRSTYDVSALALSFGVPTAIGLMAAPYADQTFWQRVFCLEPRAVRKTFFTSAYLFGLIPLLFGLIGFVQPNAATDWSLGLAFPNGAPMALLTLCVTAALLSTIDSNLCAASAIAMRDFGYGRRAGILAMIVVLAIGSTIIVSYRHLYNKFVPNLWDDTNCDCSAYFFNPYWLLRGKATFLFDANSDHTGFSRLYPHHAKR